MYYLMRVAKRMRAAQRCSVRQVVKLKGGCPLEGLTRSFSHQPADVRLAHFQSQKSINLSDRMTNEFRHTSKQCCLLKEREYVVIGGRPCRVLELNKLNTGECLIVGRDVFTGGVVEEVHSLTDNIVEPHISIKDMKLISATRETCVIENPSTRTSHTIDFPEGPVADEIEEIMAYQGGQIWVTVASVMGKDGIIGVRLMMS